MWAQLITTRLKAGHEGDLPRLAEELEKIFDETPEFVDLRVVEEFVP